jgi:hypothetical protein
MDGMRVMSSQDKVRECVVGRSYDHMLNSIALAAYAQQFVYFYIVLLVQFVYMFKDIGLNHKDSWISMTVRFII